jgi:hypothetical protein
MEAKPHCENAEETAVTMTGTGGTLGPRKQARRMNCGKDDTAPCAAEAAASKPLENVVLAEEPELRGCLGSARDDAAPCAVEAAASKPNENAVLGEDPELRGCLGSARDDAAPCAMEAAASKPFEDAVLAGEPVLEGCAGGDDDAVSETPLGREREEVECAPIVLSPELLSSEEPSAVEESDEVLPFLTGKHLATKQELRRPQL